MKIFDCHTHIPEGSAKHDLSGTYRQNVIFNSVNEYKKHGKYVPRSNTVSLIFDFKKNFEFVKKEVLAGNVQSLKIHNRTQELGISDYPKVIHYLKKLPRPIPIIYDAFYYGGELKFQPSLPQVIELATLFPKNPFIIAHCGGYKIIEYFYHLRTLANIHYDLSFSLQYLYDSSLFLDLKKLIKYSDKNKIMFGSDFPWASPRHQFNILKKIFTEIKLADEDRKKILFQNAEKMFKRGES